MVISDRLMVSHAVFVCAINVHNLSSARLRITLFRNAVDGVFGATPARFLSVFFYPDQGRRSSVGIFFVILFPRLQRQEHINQLELTERTALRKSEERFHALTEHHTDPTPRTR
jgi:hypothetical protein